MTPPPPCAGTSLMARELACPNEAGSYTGRGLSPWVGLTKLGRSQRRDQTNPASGALGWGLGVGLTTPLHKQARYGNYYNNYIVVVAVCPSRDERGKKKKMSRPCFIIKSCYMSKLCHTIYSNFCHYTISLFLTRGCPIILLMIQKNTLFI